MMPTNVPTTVICGGMILYCKSIADAAISNASRNACTKKVKSASNPGAPPKTARRIPGD